MYPDNWGKKDKKDSQYSWASLDVTQFPLYMVLAKTTWNVWQTSDEVTFLVYPPPKTSHNLILRFCNTPESCHMSIIVHTEKKCSLESVPPILGALTQHIWFSAFQASHIWGWMFVAWPEIPDAVKWDWKQTQTNEWKPLWTIE